MKKKRATYHAKNRIKERTSIGDGHAMDKNIERAFKKGIKHRETKGELSSWLSGKYFNNKTATKLRIYDGYLYIFSKNSCLLTMYPLPEDIKLTEETVDPYVLKRYNNAIKEKERINDEKKQNKYNEKKKEFLKKVLLHNINEFSADKYNVRFTTVKIEDDTIYIYYIPDEPGYIDFFALRVYIEIYEGKKAKLVRVKDQNGNNVYNKPRKTTLSSNTSFEDDTKTVYTSLFHEYIYNKQENND